MSSKKVVILYYSGSGNTKKMAKAILNKGQTEIQSCQPTHTERWIQKKAAIIADEVLRSSRG